MTLSTTWRACAATASALLLALLAPLAHAQSDASATGTYMVEGGSYMIELRQDGDTLVVVEPNKESPYARQGDGSYTFYNPNTETNYGIRILDANTIEAFKPDHPESEPTRLVRMGGTVASDDAEPAGSADADRYGAMAEHYQQLAQDDPANIQAWTACSAVALKRSVSNPPEADAYAAQMAGMLQQMDVSTSPCPDAMPGW
ncbi:MAG: hypothetical protein ACJ8GK_06625 [Luteimonas sp.]